MLYFKKNVPSKRFLTLFVTATMLFASGCASIPAPQDALNGPVGGGYLLVKKIDMQKPMATLVITPTEFRQLQKLQAGCAAQLGPQLDGLAVKSIAKEGVLYALGDGIGTFLGILTLNPGNLWVKYLGYGAGAGAGNGVAYGIDRHDMAIKYAEGYCMSLQVVWQHASGQLVEFAVVPNMDAVSAHAFKAPTTKEDPREDPSAKNRTNDVALPLPPSPD